MVLDGRGRIIAVLLGMPTEDDNRPPEDRWETAMQRVAELFEVERSALDATFKGKLAHHHRGEYVAVSTGISYGGGQKVGLSFIPCRH